MVIAIRLVKRLANPLSHQRTVAKWLVIGYQKALHSHSAKSPKDGDISRWLTTAKSLVVSTNGHLVNFRFIVGLREKTANPTYGKFTIGLNPSFSSILSALLRASLWLAYGPICTRTSPSLVDSLSCLPLSLSSLRIFARYVSAASCVLNAPSCRYTPVSLLAGEADATGGATTGAAATGAAMTAEAATAGAVTRASGALFSSGWLCTVLAAMVLTLTLGVMLSTSTFALPLPVMPSLCAAV